MDDCGAVFTANVIECGNHTIRKRNRYKELSFESESYFCRANSVDSFGIGGDKLLKYPANNNAQQILLAPLTTLIHRVPACESWISFMNTVSLTFDQLSVAALQNLSAISRNMGKVFDYLHTSQEQSVVSSQYLLQLSLSAYQTATSAALAAKISTGTITLTLNQGAQNALSTLGAWDAVQNYSTPSNPSSLANVLMEGVSIP